MKTRFLWLGTLLICACALSQWTHVKPGSQPPPQARPPMSARLAIAPRILESLVPAKPQARATKWGWVAASTEFEDVANAMAKATNGQVIQIPAGTSTWTQTLIPPTGTSVVGAGTNQTFLIDEVPRTPNNAPLFRMSGTNFEIAGITFKRGVTNVAINNVGCVRIDATNFRMHDLFFDHVSGLAATIVSTMGLVDHVVANIPEGEVFQTFAPGYGDKEWANPVFPGTANALYLEDSWFGDNNWNPATDAYCGSILVIRHCVFTNSWAGNHGTDSSQRQRSCRWMEVYQNSFYFPPAPNANVPWPWVIYYRGGSGVVWSNSFAGRFTAGVKMANYRNQSGTWPPWGAADGTSPWDGNTDPSGYPVLDQCGRGSGDLITGSPPLNSVTGTAAWPHNQSQPIYVWGNQMAIDTSQEAGVQNTNILNPRDYVVGTAPPGYIPFIYPHPLQTNLNFVPSPPTNPPSPPTGSITVRFTMVPDSNLGGMSTNDYATNFSAMILTSTNVATPTNLWSVAAVIPVSSLLSQGPVGTPWTYQIVVDAQARFFSGQYTNTSNGGVGPFFIPYPLFWGMPTGAIGATK